MKKTFISPFPMRNILIGFFFAFTFLAPLAAYSQPALSASIINFPDTAYLQSIYTVSVSVKNTGNAAFTDTVIRVNYATDSIFTPILLGDITVMPPLNFGDSVFLTQSLTIDSAGGFGVPGTYIVVVWATSSVCKTADSAWTNVFVKDTLSANGIHEFYSIQVMNIYPNPASSVLFIESTSSKNTAERVRISDILGKIILDIPATSTTPSASESETIKADLSSFRSGIYILEIMDNSGQRHRMKFIKNSL